MLKLILGRAKSGKTSSVMQEIRALTRIGEGSIVLLVPEQYSHEAERELLRVCGDSLSLHAEVLSFSRLALNILRDSGEGRRRWLDPGGRSLCMALALDAVGSRLKVYSAARRQSALQESLLSAIDEFKTACVSPEALEDCAEVRNDGLGDKLRDLALVYSAYEAICARTALDPMDRLSFCADSFPASRFAGRRIYIDGFTDFTAQQNGLIRAMLQSGCAVTVCLSCEGLEESHEIFEPSHRAAARLLRMAQELGLQSQVNISEKRPPESPMEQVEAQLFSFKTVEADSDGRVKLAYAPSVTAECEAAAARCLSLVQSGCRWRDIAVAVRGYDGYRAALENIFSRYGVPLYSARKSDIFEKPIPSLVRSAFAIIGGGWSYEDMFTYLKTGLAGLTAEDCDELENYVFLWSLRGNAWTKAEDWHLHPDGYDAQYDDDTWQRLERINALRRRVAAPLEALQRRGAEGRTAREHCAALAEFFSQLRLPETLEKRARELHALGYAQTAAEYSQLWEIIVGAAEQCAAILGDTEMDFGFFGEMYCLVLSKYELGSIPLSLDKVSAGDMDRMRRRSIKHLIVLGCDSAHVPLTAEGSGIFSDDDREELRLGGIDIGDSPADRLYREFSLAYNCLSLPSDSLYVSWCSADAEGGKALPSFVVSRLEKVFALPPESVDIDLCRSYAISPAFELAARAESADRLGLSAAARDYFTETGRSEELARLASAAALSRGRLSRDSVRALYGDKLRLSASRIDKMAACPFSYFLQYGLKAKPRQAAEFAPPEMGTFMHYVLENVAHDISEMGGFAAVSQSQTNELCDKYVEQYIHDRLNDFREKSPRFVYLFRRLISNVRAVVADMAAELARSDFKPLDFELDFGAASEFPPVELGEGDRSLVLTGIADRVDGWLHDGKLYVRVVDYKTGKKKFSLSDVWYGMGLQMLLYLFALQRSGSERYGAEIVPAGVMYVPARDVLVSAKAGMSAEEILAEKLKAHRRSGLVLANDDVLAAMERGDSPCYIPVKLKNGVYSGDIASAERLGLLSRHIDRILREMAGELHSGCIAADPYFRTQMENACHFCDYAAACHFGSADDKIRYLKKMKPDEVWEKLEEGGGEK